MAAIADKSQGQADEIPCFRASYAPPDEEITAALLDEAANDEAAEARIDVRAARFVTAIRARTAGLGGIEDLLHEFALSTKEGLALMVLAEALLRIPDDATADRLIEDRLAAADFPAHEVRSNSLLVSASAWALGASARIVAAHETPESILAGIARRLGQPAIRVAIRRAMRLLGSHFVLGQTIEEAMPRAAANPALRYSFDMLGEGARTADDAERYFAAYAEAIEAIGKRAGRALPNRPGISVKLSALHPRYEAISRERVLAELTPKVVALAAAAKAHDLAFTVDAEEADRLELSLDIVARMLAEPSLAGWAGFGVAVQAYQKRACAVVDWLIAAATALDRQVMVRLVKGAYWDTEVKRAQERGLADYPVFTRKAMTDLSYLACARKLLAARPRVYPQFATHNALTIASVIEMAQGVEGYEFQRLHGMGEALFEALRTDEPASTHGVYAPVGGHRDLLAYLVRRLLENGANTSFVSVASDPSVPLAVVLTPPHRWIKDAQHARHPKIPLPKHLYGAARRNSLGVEFGDQASLARLLADIVRPAAGEAAPLVSGIALPGHRRPVVSPIDGATIGSVVEGDEAIVISAMADAHAAFPRWAATPTNARAAVLMRAADLIESKRGVLVGLLQAEGGKTLDDCVAEVREAADFCRYYANEAERALGPETMPGPTGESNALHYRGRGVFVCISPWNFPLAIFTGQIAAALAAGNAVLAKPAEQTPLIAAETVRLLHAAGVPPSVLHLVPGDGRVGALLVADPRVAGVAFTGSTEVARLINRALAAKEAPIVPLIAETGGINAMIVDATALPEQVTDDVVTSAFRSAGQRCSALRLLCVQDDIADRVFEMVIGAAQALRVGDPRDVSTHVGPVIDADSKDRLAGWIARMEGQGRVLFRADAAQDLPSTGCFVPPTVIELDRARDLKQEVFGPILHVVRYRASELDQVLSDIAGNGYALTLGIQSRIEAAIAHIVASLSHGNVYVNRSMIGAVVGTQPFGGHVLSGTGPKAGGPNYLRRFAIEQTVTVNTAAVGGNVGLLAETEEELNKYSAD
jgi:RHH-type proline utilization regulon transcriptional repressor/proline dehydrogenase/delta 1-pyrroline-5-carboxylate dehydrogenase